MNKNVIYVEPGDDITDILTKIENSKEKIVALVPPKKAGVLRSMVNIKLINKTSSNTGKSVVLVTTDPSIVKLASVARIPVTRDLQSAPSIPEVDLADDTKTETVATDEDGKAVPEAEVQPEAGAEAKDSAAERTTQQAAPDVAEPGDEPSEPMPRNGDKEEDAADGEDQATTQTDQKPKAGWLRSHKKLVVFCSVLITALVAVGIWAFVIAPAVKIIVDVRTIAQNFSETVEFSRQLPDENIAEGKFYLAEKKLETKNEIEFTATGTKNIGEKATGQIIAYAYFAPLSPSIPVAEGTSFTIGDLTYVATAGKTLDWSGDPRECTNYEGSSVESVAKFMKDIMGGKKCIIHTKVSVAAVAPGAKYNIAAATSGWSSSDNRFSVYSEEPMSGGTDEVVTIVQQSDIDAALAELKVDDEAKNKAKLMESIGADSVAIESSFKQNEGEVKSKPAVGEEVKDGEKPTLSVTTTDAIFTLDKTKVIEFVSEKAKLADGYRIYSINEPFVENFISTEDGMSGKLKTSLVTGPKITENEVVEMARGKGIGTAQRDIKDTFPGVSSVHMETSFPWVTTVPNDTEKITAEIGVEE